MVAFATTVVAGVGFSLHILERSQQNHRVLGELEQLEEATLALKRSGANYLENPARDFDTYERDVQVFLKEILGDIEQFDSRLATLSAEFAANTGEMIPPWVPFMNPEATHDTVAQQLDRVTGQWSALQEEFFTQLGDTENDPRLEWGAEHLVESMPAFSQSVMEMTDQYRAFLDDQSHSARRVLSGLVILIAVLGVFGIFWFYSRVIRRIGDVVDACSHVAQGEFGYSLTVSGDDEISVLARAFNTLSSRSQLVMAMLSDLQQSPSVEHALNSIVQASGSYLPVGWVGLLQVHRQAEEFHLTHALPAKSISSWGPRTITRSDSLAVVLDDALVSREPVLINDLRKQALGSAQAGFLRELVRATQMEALVALPLASGAGWEGFILFGSRRAGYRNDQIELLKNLAPTTALSLQRILQGTTRVS